MLKTKLSILFSLLLFVGAVVLCGCSNNSQIKFNRKSVFSEYEKKNNYMDVKNKTEVSRSRGIVIYKTTDSLNRDFNINFGPSEINFNLPK